MNGKWVLTGEGGKHALFASAEFPGKLLRIEKEDLRQACLGSTADHTDDDLSTRPGLSSLQYFEICIFPKMTPYVDIPDIIPLDWEFLARLRETTITDSVIPEARAKDWIPVTNPAVWKKRRRPIGMMIVDYRDALPRTVKCPAPTLGRRLRIEIKPKAGYLSLSPLVNPSHRAKLKSSRFSLLQLLHQQGHVEKGWTKSAQGVKKSEYDPLDLFSHDALRMTRAIRNLLASPQNNLKLWYNNDCVTKNAAFLTRDMEAILKDMGIVRSAESLDDMIIENLFGTFLSGLVVPILKHETVIGKLLTLQKLDILDVDGAILVLNRLLDLCHGSKSQAEENVDKICYQTTGRVDHGHSLLCASPFHLPFPGIESRVLKLCGMIEEFRLALVDTAPELPPSVVLDDYYKKAQELVSELSVEECSYLLANWLLSLAMCDVSILFMIDQLPSDTISEYSGGSRVEGTGSDGCGFLTCRLAAGATPSKFAFMVRIIDFDQKPPKKIWDKKKTESAFARLQ